MSITRTNAKKYLAKGIGAAINSEVLQMAEEALQRGFSDWQSAKNWYFMLKDTAAGFTIAGVTLTNGSATVNSPSTGAFDALNRGVALTDSGSKLAANTTVLSLTRGSDGTVTAITLSAVVAGTSGSVTLTVAGDIPLQVGIQEYNMPTDFYEPYHMRMIGKRLPLDYIQYRYWNMKIIDHTIQGLPVAFTIYNPVSAESQNYGTYRFRVFRIPQGNNVGDAYDTVTFQYYRKFNFDADPLDIPDRYLYKFLDYCQWLLLMKKNAVDERLPAIQALASAALQSAMTDDEELAEEEGQQRLISQVEAGLIPRPLWSNSQFSLYYGEL
jgi:hypothetical protein